MYLFVISLPFTAFSVFSFCGKSIILSWFLIFLLGIVNFKKIISSFYMPRVVYVWVLALIFSIAAVFLFNGAVFGKNFTQILNIIIMLLHLPVLWVVFKEKKFDDAKKLISLLVAVSFILSLFTFYQYISYYLTFLPPLDLFRNANIYNIYRGTGIEGWSGTHRVTGTAPEPGYWAAFLLIPMSFLLPYFFHPTKFFLKKITFLALLASFFLTFGRTGWAGLAVIVLLCPLIHRIPVKIKYAYVAALMSAFMVALVIVENGFLSLAFTDLSYFERLSSLKLAFDIFSGNPFFGIGFGAFDQAVRGYDNLAFNHLVVHNFYIRLLVETGIVGIVAFLAFISFICLKIFNSLKLSVLLGNRDEIYFAESLGLAFASIVVFWFFVPGYNFSYIWFIISLIAALPIIFKKQINLTGQ